MKGAEVKLFILLFGLLSCNLSWGQGKITVTNNPAGERIDDISHIDPDNVISVGFSQEILGYINVMDALSATQILTSQLIKNAGVSLYSETSLYKDMSLAAKDIHNNKLDMICLMPRELYEYPNKHELEPFATAVRNKNVFYKYVVLVKKDKNINSLLDLKGKKLVVLAKLPTEMSVVWLETMLMREGIASSDDFFSEIALSDKTSKTVLPVFFGQKDGAIVGYNEFITMVELNPQVGVELEIIAESILIPNAAYCIRRKITKKEHRALLKETVLNIALDAFGRQLLNLFQLDDMVAYNEEYYEKSFELFKEYYGLKQKYVVKN